jgi:uncharacterized protein (DUF342 family)
MISFLVWIFDYIPHFIIYGLLGLSILALLINRLLPIGTIKRQYVKIISIGVFIISLYATGMIAVINDYKNKIQEFETQIALAEEKSNKLNSELKYVYRDKRVKLQESSRNIQDNIERQKESINRTCKLTPNMIQLHNQGVRREK